MARTAVRSPAGAPWRWAVWGGIAGWFAALVVFAPAHWLASAVERATKGRVLLQEPRGTVWNGSSQLVFTGGPGSSDAASLPGRIQWRIVPGITAMTVRVRADCCTREALAAQVRWRIGGFTLRVADSQSQWPAALATGLGTPWNTLQLDGELKLSTQDLSVEWSEGRPALSGRAELVAQRVASRLSTLRPMGSYRMTLQGGSPSTLRLDTIDGSLRLSGSGQWVGDRLRFTGEATAAPDREAALANLLNIIGRRSGPRSIITIG